MHLPVDDLRHLVTDTRREKTVATVTRMFEHVATTRGNAATVLNVFDYLDDLFPPQRQEGAYTVSHLLADWGQHYAAGAKPPADMQVLSQAEKAEIMLGSGVVFNEIGYLAGNGRKELGAVPLAMRLIGEKLQDEFLEAQSPVTFRRAQDGAHLMLHFANLALPHGAYGGVERADIEPLRAAFERMREIGTYDHVIELSGLVLSTLSMRRSAGELGKKLAPVLNTRKNYEIETVSGLYKDELATTATRAITRLTLDDSGLPSLALWKPRLKGDAPAA